MTMNYDIQLVNKNDIQMGDIIICKDGEMRTVCRNNIIIDSFMGLRLFGDSYRLGYEKVTKVINLKFSGGLKHEGYQIQSMEQKI